MKCFDVFFSLSIFTYLSFIYASQNILESDCLFEI